MDIIQGIDDIIAKTKHGRGHKITWFPDDRCLGDVELMLRNYGVKVYDRQLIDKQMRDYLDGKADEPGQNYGVTVRKAQAKWAEWLMIRSGLKITSPLVDQDHARVEPGPMPRAWGVPAKSVGVTGSLVSLLMHEFRHVQRELHPKRLLK